MQHMNPDFSNMKGVPQGGDMGVIKVCPSCQTAYYPWQTQILEERQDAHLVFVECHKCGSGQVALIVSSALGVSTVGLVTDLTSTDVLKFMDNTYVEVDDVLDIHQQLDSGLSDLLP